MSNQLRHETSPYLLQHADNPVNWHPWSENALALAKAQDKPIFLSIGYSACHWCHVMAHESFESPEIAAQLNRDYISIKVDREERPDIDGIYMSAVVAMTGQGGWPLSVWLTPDGKPFYGGTYFPPTPRYGRASFPQLLEAIANAWQNRRSELLEGAAELHRHIEAMQLNQLATSPLSADTLASALTSLQTQYDPQMGGWSSAPKFPQAMTIELILREYQRTKNQRALEMATHTLRMMARGGMYDQVGGGFHRYAVDAQWLVPHFEKMLYDNSQLMRVYLHAWQITGEAEFQQTARAIADYILREMTGAHGEFYCAQDADSEGVEGKYYVWEISEIRARLGENAPLFIAAYGIRPGGNFEGQNIPNRLHTAPDLAETFQLTPAELEKRLADCREILLKERNQRVPPLKDDKILSAWNGQMLAAMAEIGRVLDDSRYLTAAVRNAEFCQRELRLPNGRLARTRRGARVQLNAYLEDYAALADGYLELYQSVFDEKWFHAAQTLVEELLEHFSAPNGGFYDTANDHEQLLVRPRDLQDNATPSGNALAVGVLLKLAGYTGNQRYRQIAETALSAVQTISAQYPTGFSYWLQTLSFALAPVQEVALVAPHELTELQDLLAVLRQAYRPFQLTAAKTDQQTSTIALLAERQALNGQAVAYVCRNFVCQLPVDSAAKLASLLNAPTQSA